MRTVPERICIRLLIFTAGFALFVSGVSILFTT